MLWIHARQYSISKTMPARRGQLLPYADRWQVLHPAHLLSGATSPPVQGQPGVGLNTSHALRLEAWNRVSGHGAPAGTLHQAEQSSSRDAVGGAEPLAALAASLFGLSPDS